MKNLPNESHICARRSRRNTTSRKARNRDNLRSLLIAVLDDADIAMVPSPSSIHVSPVRLRPAEAPYPGGRSMKWVTAPEDFSRQTPSRTGRSHRDGRAAEDSGSGRKSNGTMSDRPAMLRPDAVPVRRVLLQAHEHADSDDGRWQTFADDVASPRLRETAGERLLIEKNSDVFSCPSGTKRGACAHCSTCSCRWGLLERGSLC
jgi:hypothetical protein